MSITLLKCDDDDNYLTIEESAEDKVLRAPDMSGSVLGDKYVAEVDVSGTGAVVEDDNGTWYVHLVTGTGE